MKLLKNIIAMCLIFIGITTISYAKFSTTIEGKGKVQLKEPIIIFEKEETKEGQISNLNNIFESNFSIRNYNNFSENNYNSIENVNEIAFKYKLKLEISSNDEQSDFPVEYKIINLKTNEEVLLDDNYETSELNLGTEKQIDEYKLVIKWKDDSDMKYYAQNVDVKIRVIANQIK